MEDNKFNLNENLINKNNNEAPLSESKNLYYNCSECSSVIEILKIDEEYIEFKCNNNHNIKINIKEYLAKIKENKNKINLNNDIILNGSICTKHKKEYLCYCFECNKHLCKKCLMSGEHSYHYKINIIEIMPNNKILKKVENLLKNKEKNKNYLIKNKNEIENKINELLSENIKKMKEIKLKNKKENNKKEKEEIKKNEKKYELKIEELKQ